MTHFESRYESRDQLQESCLSDNDSIGKSSGPNTREFSSLFLQSPAQHTEHTSYLIQK